MKYDFLIIGAGFYGSVCARELTDKGYSLATTALDPERTNLPSTTRTSGRDSAKVVASITI